MIHPEKGDIAPDMGKFLLALPRESIVLFSWTVSEYDGLGFVKTEGPDVEKEFASLFDEAGDRVPGLVFLFFPRERERDVLELIHALQREGMDLNLLRGERVLSVPTGGKNNEMPKEADLL